MMSLNQGDLDARAADAEEGRIEPLYLHVTLTDPEVIAAVQEYPLGAQRNEFVSTCLKVGVLSLRAARGVVDGDAVRREGDHLLAQLSERLSAYGSGLEQSVASTLSHYFDPSSGVFSHRVERLVGAEGDLEAVMRNQVLGAQQKLAETLDAFIGENSQLLKLLDPTGENRLVAAIRGAADEVMRGERETILNQFSLDLPDSALSRLVREMTTAHGNVSEALSTRIGEVVKEFSLDQPNSALSRLVGRVEQAQQVLTREFSLDNADGALTRLRTEIANQQRAQTDSQREFQERVLGMLSALEARKQAAQRTTTHGLEFESAVGDLLQSIVAPANDVLEECGTTTGTVRASKVGDFVVTLSADNAAAGARIVVEAKESAAYSLKSSLEEADEARRNRGAQHCLFVHSVRTAPPGLQAVSRHGPDIVVLWDAEDPATDVNVRAGLMIAKALCVRAANHDKQDTKALLEIDRSIELLRKQLDGFGEIRTTAESMGRGAEKILERARIMATHVERAVNTLADQIGVLKVGQGEGASPSS